MSKSRNSKYYEEEYYDPYLNEKKAVNLDVRRKKKKEKNLIREKTFQVEE